LGEKVSWPESKVFVGVTREAIQDAPEYTDSMPINREYENSLYYHYGRQPYWLNVENRESQLAATGSR
jgi:hypothetical protein